MPWIGTAPTRDPQPPVIPASSLDTPTLVSARGITPAHAVIEQLTASECRLRSVVFLDHGTVVWFELTVAGQAPAGVRGRITARTSNGPWFSYRIVLDGMTGKEVDHLARALAEMHRRQAKSRSLDRANAARANAEGQARSAQILSQFPVLYRTAKEDFKSGTVVNVSSGGLLMTCRDALVEGMTVELQFTLPSSVLNFYPEQTAVLDPRRATVRTGRADLRQAFEEMVVRAQVVSHQPLGDGLYKFGLTFSQIDGTAREEIARYVHAVQLSKRRA